MSHRQGEWQTWRSSRSLSLSEHLTSCEFQQCCMLWWMMRGKPRPLHHCWGWAEAGLKALINFFNSFFIFLSWWINYLSASNSVCPELSASPVSTTEVVPLSVALPIPGVPVFIGIMAWGSFVSASMSWTPHRHFDPAAPPCLLAPTSSAGLPSPSSFTLVSRRPSATSGLHFSGYTSSLWLCQAPPSIQLGPLSLQLQRGLLNPHLRLGHRSHLLCLGPPDPPCRAGSLVLCLHLRLLLHLLRRHHLAPWSR